jgi:hypothetical protein
MPTFGGRGWCWEFSFKYSATICNLVQQGIAQLNNEDVIIENYFDLGYQITDQLSSFILHSWEKVTIIHYLSFGTKVQQVLNMKY